MALTPRINEFQFDQPGTDLFEFIEVLADPGANLSAYKLLVIEGDSGGTLGNVTFVQTLGTADANGYWWTGFLPSNTLQNGSQTLLLVETSVSITIGMDLDTNNDGVLDVTPWLSILDSVAVSDGGASDRFYAGAPVLLTSHPGPVTATVGGASRIPNGTDTNATGDWVRNDFDLAGIPGFPGTLGPNEAVNTPGSANTTTITPTITPPVINEFVFDHTGADASEFIEVKSSASADLSSYRLVVIDGDSGARGTVNNIFTLGVTNVNGYWDTGYLSGVLQNGTQTVLLVQGLGTLSVGTDLDTNDDGVLDSAPWITLRDSVAVSDGGAGDLTYAGAPVLTQGIDAVGLTVGGASRIPDGTDTDAVADWVRNDFEGDGLPGLTSTALTSEAINTRGAANARGLAVVAPVINEFVFSHVGVDTNEFLELKGGANSDYSGYRFVVIDGDAAARGTVQAIITPGTTDAAGYWASAFLNSQFQNGTQTLLLVAGLTGVVTGTDLDTNDDGVLDSTPWSALADAVAVSDGDIGDLTYAGAPTLRPLYDGFAFAPGGASRLPDGVDTDGVYDWVRNDFDLFGVPGFTGTPVAGEAANTRGAANAHAVTPTPGFLVAPADITVTEGGAGSSFIVRLNTAPTANVTITLAGNPDITLGTTSLTFTTLNWATPQTVTVSAADDLAVEGIEIVPIITAAATSTDTAYNGIDPADVSVTVNDNEPIPPLAIHDIQGSAHLSPFRDQMVRTSGVVTAIDRTNNGAPGTQGFWLQDPNADANDATSEAIFVFTGTTAGLPAIGDALDIIGIVRERSPGNATSNLTTTRLEGATFTILSSGNALPSATILGAGGRMAPTGVIYNDAAGSLNAGIGDFDPVNEGIDFFESLEGMRVTVENASAISPTNGFNETWVLPNLGAASAGKTARGGVLLGQGDDNPERIQVQWDSGVLPIAGGPQAKVADRLGDVTGVMSYDFGNYELVLTQSVTVTDGGLRQETTSLTGTSTRVTIAEWNVENLDPGDSKFPELARVFDQHLRSPDIVALQEIQDNNGALNDSVTAATLTAAKLIAAIHARTGIIYSYTDAPPVDDSSGGEPGGNIRTGYLYNTNRVSLVPGSVRPLQDTAATTGNAFASSRKPLAADFRFNNNNITLINVHSSSKGGGTSVYGSQQPAVNGGEAARIAQATEIRAVVDGILAANASAKLAVLGDFNEFGWNPSQQVLTGGATPVLFDLNTLESVRERYTYIFDGSSQALDHTLGTAALRRVAQHDTVHVNSEFTDAMRTSDHDPAVTRLSLSMLGAPETPSFVGGPGDVTQTFLMQAGGTVGGGLGADLLIGRAGVGTLEGGAGADLFAFLNGGGVGVVTISDFVAGTDQLTLQGFAAGTVDAIVAAQTFSGGATNLALPDGTVVMLAGVASVNNANFI